MRTSRIVLGVVGLLGLSLPGLCADPPRPALDVWVSAGDAWWMCTWLALDSPASIRDSVRLWHDVLNVQRIYWRGQQEEMMLDYGIIRRQNLQYGEFFDDWERFLIKTVGVNRLLVEEAHRRNMQVYIWAPLFDFGGPADSGGCKEYPYFGQFKLTLEHPEWMPVDRYGTRRQNGPIELSYPEARKALIKMYVDYLRNDHYDGMAFFTYNENYDTRFEDEFGYNQPIVDEYRRRFGVDIRSQEFDKNLWRYLRGEYVTQFLAELKTELKAHGKKLGIALNPREPNYPQPWNVSRYTITAGRIYMDWERWVREGLVDELHIYGGAPPPLRERTLANVFAAVRGTGIEVEQLTSGPFDESFKPWITRGLRMDFFATDEAHHIEIGYPEQPPQALAGKDVYAAMRVLAQSINGKTKATVEEIAPLTRHEFIPLRRMALQALGAMKDPAALPLLHAALDDPERSVRAAAALSMGNVHGSGSVLKLIETVRRVREFQIFEAASTALTAMIPEYLPQVLAAAQDPDPRIRQLAIYSLGRKGPPEALPALVAALKDQDLYTRFRAAHALQAYGHQTQAVEALLEALKDTDPIVQDRAALSLAIALVPGSTVPPRLGLESAVRILATPCGTLRAIELSPVQLRALNALAILFRQFGIGSRRSDMEWGFRPVGNAMLAFGAEGGRRLQTIIDERQDQQLAELAWQVLYIRQGMENFCPLVEPEQEASRIAATNPLRVTGTEITPGRKYSPLDK